MLTIGFTFHIEYLCNLKILTLFNFKCFLVFRFFNLLGSAIPFNDLMFNDWIRNILERTINNEGKKKLLPSTIYQFMQKTGESRTSCFVHNSEVYNANNMENLEIRLGWS
ncbi:unnamed protein product [Orchesella dallaii]|uniref:Uncharacterized protein n=1 Tax=Orchesella dallaii TaxID=48710 RepID=A0ABP1QD63_9HEXA